MVHYTKIHLTSWGSPLEIKGYLSSYLRFFGVVRSGDGLGNRLRVLSNCLLFTLLPLGIVSGIQIQLPSYRIRYDAERYFCPGGFGGIYATPSYEDSVKRLLSGAPSGDFIDAGANYGFYSILMGRTRKVLAIEPNPVYFEFLVRNIDINRRSNNVIPSLCACWSSDANLSLLGRKPGDPLDSHVESLPTSSSYVLDTVRGRTIDSMVDEHGLRPAVIKMDVEGAEVEALRGASHVLEEFRPLIVFETRDSTRKECVQVLSRLGYSVESLGDSNNVATSTASD